MGAMVFCGSRPPLTLTEDSNPLSPLPAGLGLVSKLFRHPGTLSPSDFLSILLLSIRASVLHLTYQWVRRLAKKLVTRSSEAY